MDRKEFLKSWYDWLCDDGDCEENELRLAYPFEDFSKSRMVTAAMKALDEVEGM